jgi:hypothetical protein
VDAERDICKPTFGRLSQRVLLHSILPEKSLAAADDYL